MEWQDALQAPLLLLLQALKPLPQSLLLSLLPEELQNFPLPKPFPQAEVPAPPAVLRL
jgi:hypothetical protein